MLVQRQAAWVNNYWDDGSPFDHTAALAVLNASATGTPWHTADYGSVCALPPGINIHVAWCQDMKDEAQRKNCSIAICYGNWLFSYGDGLYQLSQEGHEVFNRVFPENK